MSWPAWTVHYSPGRGITQTIFCRALRSISLRPESAPPRRCRLHSADQGLITHCHWFTTFEERQCEGAWDGSCGCSPGPTLKSNLVHRPRKRQSECDGLKEQEKREHLETVPERIQEKARIKRITTWEGHQDQSIRKMKEYPVVWMYDLRPIKRELTISNDEKSLNSNEVSSTWAKFRKVTCSWSSNLTTCTWRGMLVMTV